MSLKSRIELYTWFTKWRWPVLYSPLFALHAGTTGLSIHDRVKYLYKNLWTKDGVEIKLAYLKPRSRHDDETYHNCSSINLYDEDIVYILRSGGIIGLSFDQRILGFADENVLPGVTCSAWCGIYQPDGSRFLLGRSLRIFPFGPMIPMYGLPKILKTLILLFILICTAVFWSITSFIYYGWQVTTRISMLKSSKTNFIGTDFDGLINAIDCCKGNAPTFYSLKKICLRACWTCLNLRAGYRTQWCKRFAWWYLL